MGIIRLFIISIVLSLLIIPSMSSGATNEELDVLHELFRKAEALEKTNIIEAKSIYNKIIKKHPNTYDDRMPETFAFAFEAMERLKVIACKERGVKREDLSDFDEFYSKFVKSINNKDRKSLEKLISCYLVVGKAESGDTAFEGPDSFSAVIIKYLPSIQSDLAIVNAHLHTVDALNHKHKSYLVIDMDRQRAGLYLERGPVDFFKHEFIFIKEDYWLLYAYLTGDDEYLKTIRNEIWDMK